MKKHRKGPSVVQKLEIANLVPCPHLEERKLVLREGSNLRMATWLERG